MLYTCCCIRAVVYLLFPSFFFLYFCYSFFYSSRSSFGQRYCEFLSYFGVNFTFISFVVLIIMVDHNCDCPKRRVKCVDQCVLRNGVMGENLGLIDTL
jgi:hypothetical protein